MRIDVGQEQLTLVLNLELLCGTRTDDSEAPPALRH